MKELKEARLVLSERSPSMLDHERDKELLGDRSVKALRMARSGKFPRSSSSMMFDDLRRAERPEANKTPEVLLDVEQLREKEDRKSVVEGKRVSVRVDIGGRRSIKKKKNKKE